MTNTYDFAIKEEKKTSEPRAVKTASQDATKEASKRSVISTVPLFIATIIVMLTVALIWTDIRIKDLLTVHFAADLLAFLLLFYMMFFTLQDFGNRGGRLDKEYAKVHERYLAEREKVRSSGAELDLPDFCDFYATKELRDIRRRILLNANIRIEEWEQEWAVLDDYAMLALLPRGKFMRKIRSADVSKEIYSKLIDLRKMSTRKKTAIVRACLVKPLDISPDLIMLDDGDKASRSPIAEKSIKEKQMQKDAFALARITAMMFLSISIAGEIIVDFSYATLVFGVIKLASLIVTGYQGYLIGYTIYTGYGVRRHNDQINLLSIFWRWKADREKEYGNVG